MSLGPNGYSLPLRRRWLTALLLVGAMAANAQEPVQSPDNYPEHAAAVQAAGEAQSAADAAAAAADAAAMAGSRAAGPPRGTRLELQLRDMVTQRPVAGAGTYLDQHPGLGLTDRAGKVVWYLDDAYAKGEIQIRCPATRALSGRRIKRVPFYMEGNATVVTAGIRLAECIEPPERSTAGTYTGYYQSGFESSQFIPCQGLPEDAGFYGYHPNGAWVELDANTYQQLRKQMPAGGGVLEQGIYVTWEGVLKGPGSYGHMGVSSYHFRVTRVLDASYSAPANCAAIPQN